MALAYDQQTIRARLGGADSAAMTSAQAVDAGDLLVVCISTWFSNGTVATWAVSGSLNGSYTSATSQTSPGSPTQAAVGIFYKENSGAGSETVTVNPNGSTADINFTFSEVSGAETSGALDKAVPGTEVSPNQLAIATGTLSQADEIIFGIMSNDDASITLTPDATYTQIGEDESNSGGQSFNAQYKIVSTTASDTADWTITPADYATFGCIATFKQLGGGLPPVTDGPKLNFVSSPMIWR